MAQKELYTSQSMLGDGAKRTSISNCPRAARITECYTPHGNYPTGLLYGEHLNELDLRLSCHFSRRIHKAWLLYYSTSDISDISSLKQPIPRHLLSRFFQIRLGNFELYTWT